MQKVKYDLNQPNLDVLIIENALRKNRNLKVVVGFILVCLAGSIIFSAMDSFAPKFAFPLALVCMFFGFSGVYFLLSAILRYDTQKNYVLKLITQHLDSNRPVQESVNRFDDDTHTTATKNRFEVVAVSDHLGDIDL